MKHRRGFTLIELMMVVAIIGILAAVALPSYWSSVMKSRRTSAQAALLDLASREERYYTAKNIYTSDLSQLGFPAGTSVPVPDGANNYFYDVSVEVLAPDSFSLKAVPVGSQTKDTACATYTYNSRGIRGNTGGTASDSCWN